MQLPVMTGNEATEAAFGWVYKQPGMVTLEDCRRSVMMIDGKFGEAEAVALLQRFGCKGVIDLWMGMFEDFCKFAAECHRSDVPPSACRAE